ncbi:MAG: hypothetical protein KatS3mg109_1338 [Pirellulaceae bacterium]|nr:MAG: hypothetical protein KatS3mg109_1200 [Pirellulaceae bacterium]GIW90906.1 MAG: hypothetical protein KatS3mg109_1338 [Pirellulaceae bacterium]
MAGMAWLGGAGTAKMHDRVAVVVAIWRAHHSACAQCGQHDVHDPGLPIVSFEPRDDWRAVKTRRGMVWFSAQPDPAVLCPTGRQLFRQWQRMTTKSQPLGVDDD